VLGPEVQRVAQAGALTMEGATGLPDPFPRRVPAAAVLVLL